MKEFEKNNSIYFECTYRDFDGAITAPSSPAYKIKDSKGTDVDTGTPVEKETGVYYFYWVSTTVDTYIVEFTGTIGGQAGVARQLFKVTETKVK